MRVLVTGGAGFIGSHLVDRLVKDGHDVTVLDDLSYGSLKNLSDSAGSIRFIEGSILDQGALQSASAGAEAIFHLAAISNVQRSLEEPDETCAVNAGGTQRVVEAAAQNGSRLIFSSSSAVYGNLAELPASETSVLLPVSPYGGHKLSSEIMIERHCEATGLPGVSLRYFNVYGQRQSPTAVYAAVVALFVRRVITGQPLMIFGDGLNTRDFIHVSDVVEANMRALVADNLTGQPINIASGESVTVLHLAQQISALAGVPEQISFQPARRGEVRYSACDVSRARAQLGFSPRVPLAEGLAKLVQAAKAP